MTPTSEHSDSEIARSSAPTEAPRPHLRDFRVYAAVLLLIALGLGGVLIARGEALPSLVALLILGVLAAFAVNRYTFFPSEMSVTGEVAIAMAAVVLFHGDAPFLGPWCLGLLMGPLDAVHWEQRAFARMAYNAANQMLAALAAAWVFHQFHVGAMSAGMRFMALPIAASVAFMAVSVITGVGVLYTYPRSPVLIATRHLIALDGLTIPLGAIGAAAGWLALATGAYTLPLLLIPAAFVPEWWLGGLRDWAAGGPGNRHRRAFVSVCVAAVLVAVPIAMFGLDDGVLVGALGVVVVLAGLELGPGTPPGVPSLVGVLAMAPVVAVGGRAGGVIGIVAATVTVMVMAIANRSGRAATARLLATVVCASVVAVGLGLLVATTDSSDLARVSIGGVATVAVSRQWPRSPRGDRRTRQRELVLAGWSIGALAFAIACMLAVRQFGSDAALAPVVGIPLSAALIVWMGLPLWNSRELYRWVTSAWPYRSVALITSSIIAIAGAIAVTRASGQTLIVLALSTLALVEAALACAAALVRQWRLAPRARALAAGAVGGTALTILVGYPLAALDGRAWSLAFVFAGAAVVLLASLRLARHADDAARTVPADAPGELDVAE